MSCPAIPCRRQCRLDLHRVALITKVEDRRVDAYAERLSGWLEGKGIAVSLNRIETGQEMVIVLGGDGTLLHIAENAARHGIPVLGINLGNLGFLTELTESEALPVLEQLLTGPATVENRLMLKARLCSNNGPSPYRYALNDVVISKNVLDRLLDLAATADGEYITTYRADGLIFSSPTGSTAYNLSAGGPLVYPGLATITVTPICPFMLSSRPIILPADKRIRTRLAVSHGGGKAQVIVDGQAVWEMAEGDELEVATASHPLQLVVSSGRDYFTVVRNKLHWGVSGSSRRSISSF